jgi:hypothetical protein
MVSLRVAGDSSGPRESPGFSAGGMETLARPREKTDNDGCGWGWGNRLPSGGVPPKRSVRRLPACRENQARRDALSSACCA